MLDSIRFVKGAVEKKSFVPDFSYFAIREGRIYGGNGVVTLSAPIAIELEAYPKAETFGKLLEQCNGPISLALTGSGRLRVQADGLRGFVDCLPTARTEPAPAPAAIAMRAPLLPVLRALVPFVSEDASRPWSRGVLLRQGFAHATNNVVLVRAPIVQEVPEINLPMKAVRELLRIGEEPTGMALEATTAVFHYASGQWMRTSLLSCEWPNLERLFGLPFEYRQVFPDLQSCVERIKPFVDPARNSIIFRGNSVGTHTDPEFGVHLEMEHDYGEGTFSITYMQDVAAIAENILLVKGAPSGFTGGGITGVLAGMRDEG